MRTSTSGFLVLESCSKVAVCAMKDKLLFQRARPRHLKTQDLCICVTCIVGCHHSPCLVAGPSQAE